LLIADAARELQRLALAGDEIPGRFGGFVLPIETSE